MSIHRQTDRQTDRQTLLILSQPEITFHKRNQNSRGNDLRAMAPFLILV